MSGETRIIQLSKGLATIVDADLYEELSKFRWAAVRGHSGQYYARRSTRAGSGDRSKSIILHRVIMDARPGQLVDHRDGNTLNNTRANLRICSPHENTRNMHASKSQRKGGFKGVRFHARCVVRPWQAYIVAPDPNGAHGRQRSLGFFIDAESAARAYDDAARSMFGDFAAPNFP